MIGVIMNFRKATQRVCILLVLGLHVLAVKEMNGNSPQHIQPGQNTHGTWYDKRLQKRGAIYFYDSGSPYYEFTNFYRVKKLRIDGFDWPTTEQYYQAGRFTDNSIRNLIRTGNDRAWPQFHITRKVTWGVWAFDIAHKFSNYQRADWFNVGPKTDGMQRNVDRMLNALRAKFKQNKKLGALLLKTHPNVLIEDSYQDGYFGAGNPVNGIPQGSGENLLGRMLMHVRRELFTGREKPFDTKSAFSLDYLLNPKNDL